MNSRDQSYVYVQQKGIPPVFSKPVAKDDTYKPDSEPFAGRGSEGLGQIYL